MPINARLLKEKQKPIKERILEFLERQPGQAFTLNEIAADLEGHLMVSEYLFQLLMEQGEGRTSTDPLYVEALAELSSEEAIESGAHRGDTYYYLPERP